MLDRLEAIVDAVFDREWPWWLWPGLLAAMGTIAVALSLVFGPGPHNDVLLWGHPLDATCAFLEQTGLPCPQCGMTRSWVHLSRGHVLAAFRYNPAGASLWLWLVAGGVVGWGRLITRTPTRWAPGERLLTGWAVFWLGGLYALAYVLRIAFGINPIPG